VKSRKVSKPPVGLFQIGFQQESHVAIRLVAQRDLIAQHGEPEACSAAPHFTCACEHSPARLGIAYDDPPVEQSELYPKVRTGHSENLSRCPDGVVEADTFVPDRIPNRIGDLRHVAPLAVDEDDVEVAVGTELVPPVPAYGKEGQTLEVTSGRRQEQFGQLSVGSRAVYTAEVDALESWVC
jgi:hypothetical protein